MGFGPAWPAGRPCRALEGFVPGRRPRHGLPGRFSGRAGPRSPVSLAGRAGPKSTERGKRTAGQAAAARLHARPQGRRRRSARARPRGRRRLRARPWGRRAMLAREAAAAAALAREAAAAAAVLARGAAAPCSPVTARPPPARSRGRGGPRPRATCALARKKGVARREEGEGRDVTVRAAAGLGN
ncbi:uncharacterized protein [Miscanthus floridulus]|uniref:uncharacterized protein n=1 Tax=Miscanthus floridulus TaxID=154761 RepID=UPI00345AED1D